MTARSQKVASLDGLRGIAAVYVMIYHYQMHPVYGHALFRAFVDHGYLSVDLFFILSGYVITLADRRLFDDFGGMGAVRWFLTKRIARVYPLYILSTLIALVIVRASGQGIDTSPATILANVFMVQGWGLGDSINGATWSLSTEWAAYLLFPVICLIGRGRIGGLLQIGLGAILLGLAASPLVDHTGTPTNGPLDLTGSSTLWPVARCLGGFLIGCGLHRLPVTRGPLVNKACGAAALLSIGSLFVQGADLLFIATISTLIVALPHESGTVGRVLTAKPIAWLGKISYSIYLLHTTVAFLQLRFPDYLPIPHGIGRVVSLALFYPGVIGCAALTYRYIEKPGQAWLRKVGGPPMLKARASTAEALKEQSAL